MLSPTHKDIKDSTSLILDNINKLYLKNNNLFRRAQKILNAFNKKTIQNARIHLLNIYNLTSFKLNKYNVDDIVLNKYFNIFILIDEKYINFFHYFRFYKENFLKTYKIPNEIRFILVNLEQNKLIKNNETYQILGKDIFEMDITIYNNIIYFINNKINNLNIVFKYIYVYEYMKKHNITFVQFINMKTNTNTYIEIFYYILFKYIYFKTFNIEFKDYDIY